jgi:hypothetical protein
MKRTELMMFSIVLSELIFSQSAFAIGGEVFRIKVTSGSEYCDPFDYGSVSKGYTNFWIRVDNDSQITLARSPDFTQYPIVLTGRSFLYGRAHNRLAITGNKSFQDDGSYVSVTLTGVVDKKGFLTSLTGNALYNWASTNVQPDPYGICFGSVGLTTGKRIKP